MTEQVFQKVLVFTTEAETARTALSVLAALGVRGSLCQDAASSARKLQEDRWDLLLADADSLHGDINSFLRTVRTDAPEMPVLMTGPEGSARAVTALRAGCDDYLAKPLSEPDFTSRLAAILPRHKVPLAAACDDPRRHAIAGGSRPLRDVLEMARKVAPTSAPVLITGESGVGKELISRFVHEHSNRGEGPYVRVNCAALSESLLESELFGHERGAFTGAVQQRKGRFERAHGGTLLLDEISETGPRLQAELLRVLEQQDFERVGGSENIRVNVRVISTTNRDLAGEVRRGRFRQDLYYRIGGMCLHVPALRQRVEDLPALVWHFVNQYAAETRRRIERLDESMMDVFRGYGWPGNVRQLRNVVRTALILGEGPTLALVDAPAMRELLRPGDDRGPAVEGASLKLQELERQAIFEALRRTESHQAKAAGLLGITDRTLREKLRKYRKEGALQTAGEDRT